MMEKLKNYYGVNMDIMEHRDRIFINNPVVMQGLGLVPIVAVCSSLRNACIMALAVILLLTPTRVAAALLSRSTHFRFRAVSYAMTAAIFYTLISYLIIDVFAMQTQTIGLYLPLLVVEPLIIKRYGRVGTEKVPTAISKGLVTTLGFLIVLFAVAFLRELLGFGTLFGAVVFTKAPMPFLTQIGGGFILIGVFIALWRNGVRRFKQEAKNSL